MARYSGSPIQKARLHTPAGTVEYDPFIKS